MSRFALIPLLALTLQLVGCMTPPNRADVATMTECKQIDDELARVEAEKRKATERKEGAWKNVIPFVVIGQYVQGRQDAEAATERLELLDEQAARQGCAVTATRPAGGQAAL